MKTTDRRSAHQAEQQTTPKKSSIGLIGEWFGALLFALAILAVIVCVCSLNRRKPDQPAPEPPKPVKHRIVSNGDKFAGQVCIGDNRWYNLTLRDSYDEALEDICWGDCNWQYRFKEVTADQAKTIALEKKVTQLESRVNVLEQPKAPSDSVRRRLWREDTFGSVVSPDEIIHGVVHTNIISQ